MTRSDVIYEDRKPRPGTCHRCGWRGMVSRVSRHERQELGIDHSVSRVCKECTTDLHMTRKRGMTVQPHYGYLTPVRSRNVA